ncbi:MAG: arginyltransferase [Alphaproteobacteria bacterium]|nr:MAG: arginyltransferase [Alphaproteobacteria bacterium]
MTNQSSRYIPQFYVTAPTPCPYLEGRQERKIFTSLAGPLAETLHSELIRDGFRRSQSIAYKPACEECFACVSVRIPVDSFIPSRSQRRIINANRDLMTLERAPLATEDQFALLRTYIDNRHAEGGMADMSYLDYQGMVQDSPITTKIFEYRIGTKIHDRGPTLAIGLTDVLDDGLSMVYSFFDPAESPRSLGTYMILDHIRLARQKGLPFLYLGYWIEGCDKMNYKSKFKPLEYLKGGTWASAQEHALKT